MNYVMNLDIGDFIVLVNTLAKKNNEKRKEKQEENLLHLWGYQLPVMKNPIPFEEFKKKVLKKSKRIKKQDNTKLIEKIESISKKYKTLNERR